MKFKWGSVPVWYGYDQAVNAHPERPWWRSRVTQIVVNAKRNITAPRLEWVHPQGHIVYRGGPEDPTVEEDMATVDAMFPLPPPPPMAGQVWVVPSRDGADSPPLKSWVVTDTGQWQGMWPPFGQVLVAGPGAPWMNLGKSPEGEMVHE